MGITLPGLSSPAGSKACLSASICAFSSRLNCTHMLLSFSMPTPCSPVTRAAHRHAGFQNLGTEKLAAAQLVSVVGIEQNQWVQVAVARMEHVGAAQLVLFSISWMASRMSARRFLGMVESMHM